MNIEEQKAALLAAGWKQLYSTFSNEPFHIHFSLGGMWVGCGEQEFYSENPEEVFAWMSERRESIALVRIPKHEPVNFKAANASLVKQVEDQDATIQKLSERVQELEGELAKYRCYCGEPLPVGSPTCRDCTPEPLTFDEKLSDGRYFLALLKAEKPKRFAIDGVEYVRAPSKSCSVCHGSGRDEFGGGACECSPVHDDLSEVG